jgi:hypothetical protein
MHTGAYSQETVCTMAPEDLHSIRAGFVARGTSLTAWCRKEGLHLGYVRECIAGERKGTKARAILSRVRAAAGLSLQSEQSPDHVDQRESAAAENMVAAIRCTGR